MEVYEKPAGMAGWLLELLTIRELLEHDEYVLAHNHASGRLVSKLRIECEIEFRKELDRLLEIFHW